ncbi:MAG: SAM-dependent methyltransferase [Candidatus Dactylopiibacterium carminicum]|uniref:SAM-dependent methyltransferase n=1 Tax=Candidatus Dactylopiibacterium carminicum TaxID=857335 RepID=A0A272EU48_9RHOO|nr:methyltransferase domain-containing protein [Candidatus Dactylopiibacterium carminicum]KAF7599158.1 class I SAM-dependent methyltransferase [Candidatus Dactylopiibacterium carminicum]PAS93270.1 MAG: SAM-dependent methyltransferase [Candidatus Dactylopiibacterium carminicum]PAS97095.1 MAG: SAM-dependent methyltransferase [Candidatus Dactylopiibacterium carminicum]PAS99172.1 MAG: SAM-dependent methyltransferase [Candidatus Dactylopiibacterium carminicum]
MTDRLIVPGQPHLSRRGFLTGALAGASLLGLGARPALAQFGPDNRLDVPYVPTPQEVVDEMLRMAQVRTGDVVYDLGCGDGRVVITVAAKLGATGVGIDLDPQRISEANANARSAKVTDRVKFVEADLFTSDFSAATVVTLYLLDSVNRRLRPQLWRQLSVGTRVVSHDFSMGEEWPPEDVRQVGRSTLYRWTITEAHKRT